MNFNKTFYLFILACLLFACAAPANPAPVTPEPPFLTSTALPPATATSPAALAPPTSTKAVPRTIDPGSSVIQISYPSNSGISNSILTLVDPATGQSLPYEKSFAGSMDAITAIPGRLAAVQGTDQVCEPMAYGTACYPQADVLHLVDLTTLQEITATLPAKGWVQLAAFNSDGTRLALVDNHAHEGSSLLFFDAKKGSLLASQLLSIRPSQIAFRPGKNQLVVYGQSLGPNPGVHQPPNPHVLLLDLPDLKTTWDHELTGILSGFWCETDCNGFVGQSGFAIWYPFVVVAPDGSALYIAHADKDSLTRVDLQTHAVTSTNLQTASSWLDQLLSLSPQVAYAKGNENGTSLQGVLSPDGGRLYLLAQNFHSTLGADGKWNEDISYSGLKVIDVMTGRILKQLDTHASQLQISPDGNLLYMMNWDSPQAETEIVSTDQLQIVKKLAGWEVTLTCRLDGASIALATKVNYSTQQEVGVLDPQSFSISKPWMAGDTVQFVTFQQ